MMLNCVFAYQVFYARQPRFDAAGDARNTIENLEVFQPIDFNGFAPKFTNIKKLLYFMTSSPSHSLAASSVVIH